MSNQQIHHSSGKVMGGPWQIRHRVQPDIEPNVVAKTAYNALYKIELQMSHFKNDSDLMEFNNAPVGEWITIPTEMLTVLTTARELSVFTDGAVDVTLGQAVEDWGFGAKAVAENYQPEMPTRDTKKVATFNSANPSHCGYEIEEATGRVRKTRDITLNFASIAKGFAVDYAAKCVLAMGIENFMIEAAGEIVVKGKRANTMPWKIGLELPVPKQTLVYEELALSDIALATSGSYRKYRQVADKHLSHTLDPSNHAPIESDLLAVSIMHEQCMYADALATALFVKGAGEGSEFADKHNIAALFLIKDPEGICEIRSRAWMARIGALDN